MIDIENEKKGTAESSKAIKTAASAAAAAAAAKDGIKEIPRDMAVDKLKASLREATREVKKAKKAADTAKKAAGIASPEKAKILADGADKAVLKALDAVKKSKKELAKAGKVSNKVKKDVRKGIQKAEAEVKKLAAGAAVNPLAGVVAPEFADRRVSVPGPKKAVKAVTGAGKNTIKAAVMAKKIKEIVESKNPAGVVKEASLFAVRTLAGAVSKVFSFFIREFCALLGKIAVCLLPYILIVLVIVVPVIALIAAASQYSVEKNVEQQEQSLYTYSAGTSSVIAMSDAEVWRLISEGRFSSYREANGAAAKSWQTEKEFWEDLLTSIEVPIWKWADASDYSQGKVSSTATITVNRYLAEYFADFMTDLYNLPEQYVITDIGGFSFRTKNNGTSSTSLSAHSFGAVLDINYSVNGMKSYAAWGTEEGIPWNTSSGLTEPELSCCCTYDNSWYKLAIEYDLDWGGSWSRGSLDPMHFSLVGDNKKGETAHTSSPSDPGRTP